MCDNPPQAQAKILQCLLPAQWSGQSKRSEISHNSDSFSLCQENTYPCSASVNSKNVSRMAVLFSLQPCLGTVETGASDTRPKDWSRGAWHAQTHPEAQENQHEGSRKMCVESIQNTDYL